MANVSYEDFDTNFELWKLPPEKFFALTDDFVRQHPDDPGGYFRRHVGWERLGQFDRALGDLKTALRLEPSATKYDALGTLLYRMGRYSMPSMPSKKAGN